MPLPTLEDFCVAAPGTGPGGVTDPDLSAIEAALLEKLNRYDGRTILEATPVTAPASQFLPGGVFALDPANPRHRALIVGGTGAGESLTANMTILLDASSAEWLTGEAVTIRKGDASAFTITVLGLGLAGSDTSVLRHPGQSITMLYESATGGLGPDGQQFVRLMGGLLDPTVSDVRDLADGQTILEATPVVIASSQFLPGAAFSPEPTNARHRNLIVGGTAAGQELTANMSVVLNAASASYLVGETVTIRKGDSSAFTITVTGLGPTGTGTAVLRYPGQSVTVLYDSGPGGPGVGGEQFSILVGGLLDPTTDGIRNVSLALGARLSDALNGIRDRRIVDAITMALNVTASMLDGRLTCLAAPTGVKTVFLGALTAASDGRPFRCQALGPMVRFQPTAATRLVYTGSPGGTTGPLETADQLVEVRWYYVHQASAPHFWVTGDPVVPPV